ncbi:BTAD domain-containing putative transcriptional regulator [Streptosporangium sp. NPDC023825]|uniref:AfsR/SARP family transcriptional regulator n=1 Tax=Streptosporangium sp. NPDC023825 TaxID=3154909 RepID=UPI00341598A4
MLEFGVLGPLSVHRDGVPIEVRAGMLRRVLAVLLCRAGQSVNVSELLDELWDQAPPATARKTLQTYVHRLRKEFGDEGLIRHGSAGYSLAIESCQLDVLRFAELLDQARALREQGDAARARSLYHQALGLWRGTPFGDVEAGPILTDEVRRLEDHRLAAQEERIVLELALGLHTEVIHELTELVRAHPYRESLRAHLMLALYRSDRQVEALEAFHLTRTVLRDELGIEPGVSLQRLYEAILRSDERLYLPDAPPAPGQDGGERTSRETPIAPRQLPVDMARFTGRKDYIRKLDQFLSSASEGAAGTVVISAIAGTPGVGKTALAVHWAHRVADQFPDGQIHLNLRGHAQATPMRPIEALALLLRALGMTAEQTPVDLAESEARYRSLVADRRLLILLDNARSSAQIRPLLPGVGKSLVLITSRDRLTGLVAHDGAHRLILNAMTPQEAEGLLIRFLGRERVEAEPSPCAALVEVCARLPLALCIAAAQLADRPRQAIGEFVQDLVAGDTLASLTVEDDEERGVRAAFDLSYRALAPDERRLFRRLGLVPCADFTAPTAAALAGMTTQEASRTLNRLAAAHLIAEEDPGRFSLHDLLRQYATSRANVEDSDQDRAAAIDRLFDWYQHKVASADQLLRGGNTPPLSALASPAQTRDSGLNDYASALAWLNGERHNVVKVIDYAVHHGHSRTTLLLADRLRSYYDLLRPDMVEWLTVARSALAAARFSGDVKLQRMALSGLAQVYFNLSKLSRAIVYLRQAIALKDDSVSLTQHGNMLCNFGQLLSVVGRPDEAVAALQQAQDLYTDIGDDVERAVVLLNLANLYRDCGRLDEAVDIAEQAVRLHRKFTDTVWETMSVATLGEICHLLGRFDDAVTHLGNALAAHRGLGNRSCEAETLASLGRVHRDRGDTDSARERFEAALHLARDLDHRNVEVQALSGLASLSTHDRNVMLAIDLHQKALEIVNDLETPYLKCETYLGLAEAHHHGNHLTEATDLARQALALAEHSQFRVLQGQAFYLLARCCAAKSDDEQARVYALRALDDHRQSGHRLGAAHAHALLGELLVHVDATAGKEHAKAAEGLYTEILR